MEGFDPERFVHDFALKASVKGDIPVENEHKVTCNVATGSACGTIKIYRPIYGKQKSEN